MHKTIMATVAVLSVLLLGSVAAAQQPEPEPEPAPEPLTAEQLENLGEGYQRVGELMIELSERLSGINDSNESNETEDEQSEL